MTRKVFTRLARLSPLLALMAGLAGPAAAKVYTVSYDGDVLDLSGYIDASSLGTYNPTSFNAIAVDYSITVSLNGDFPFLFSTGDSTWGNNAFGSWGGAITIQVTDTEINISSSVTDDFNPVTLFLMTDTIHSGALENLRVSGERLGLRPSIPPGGPAVIFDSGRPIPFATAVPEPGTYALMALGLVAVGAAARRRMG